MIQQDKITAFAVAGGGRDVNPIPNGRHKLLCRINIKQGKNYKYEGR